MFGKKKEEPKPLAAVGKVLPLRLVVAILAIGGLWLLSQIILAAVSAAVGLAVIGVIALGGVAVFQALPLLAQKWENRLLAARMSEARKNPIEQAWNEYLRRCEQAKAFKAALEQIGGMVANFRSKLEQTKKAKPNYDLRAEWDALEKMTMFYQNRKDRLISATRLLEAFKEKIEEAGTKWDFQLQANAAIRAMNATDKEARINEILTEVAFDSVEQEFNEVFAKIDVDAAEISGKNQLEFAPGVTLDIGSVQIPQLEHVGAR